MLGKITHGIGQLVSIKLGQSRLLTLSRVMSVSSSGADGSSLQNRLALEKSPYLLQHANNPVDWYPWGPEAFAKAKKENKLIFLSVGYSTCHWCHVMEHESFENEEIGQMLNENFVSVKVDREERPDVDKVYMTFIQASVGSGGWPMSVWLTPDLEPIVGGTYFPPDDRYHGRPGFKTMLQKIVEQWNRDNDKMKAEGKNIKDTLMKHCAQKQESSTDGPTPELADKCYRMLERSYDKENGGFGKAPKFPQPVNFSFMFKIHAQDPSSAMGKAALNMCTHTLKMMAKGGMYDYIADGFHRYSTDDEWHVPHFEKMLYDQAQLAVIYAEAYQITKDELFSEVTRNILKYISRDLSHKSGGFYSAEDADSYPTHEALKKKEGAFCVWSNEEICSLLDIHLTGQDDKTHADVFGHHFGIKPEGNVNPYQDPHDELKGQNVLISRGDIQSTADHFGLTSVEVEQILSQSKETLYKFRKGRPPAHLDNKIITAWNGLMISGFAKAGRILGEQSYVGRAQQAVQFIQEHLHTPESGRLLRSCYLDSDGEISQISSPIEAFVDDYAFLIRGLLDLYEACFDVRLLEWAEGLQDKMDELFWDRDSGGYYMSGEDDSSIIFRLKDDQDGAEPSANSVAANNLLRLSALLDQPQLRDQAVQIFRAFRSRLDGIPIALPEMVTAFVRHLKAPAQIIVIGDRTKPDTQAMLSCISSHFLPGAVLLLVDEGSREFLQERLPVVRDMERMDGRATAYVCENFTCSLPVNAVHDLENMLTTRTSRL